VDPAVTLAGRLGPLKPVDRDLALGELTYSGPNNFFELLVIGDTFR